MRYNVTLFLTITSCLLSVQAWTRPSRTTTATSAPPNATAVQEYVAKMEQQDAQDDDATVGVKSNALGDPDGEGSSDDDDSDDWHEFEQELLEELMEPTPEQEQDELQVQFQVMEGETNQEPIANEKRWNGQEILAAWQPHLYLPPSGDAIQYLSTHARSFEGRLDRRTLYASLLLEWRNLQHRKFLSPATSQALQSACSLATQPKWRQAFPRPNGIRLYEQEEPNRGCTLAMQETIAMALAHSLGVAMVVIDDEIIANVRQELVQKGYKEEEVKPAFLIQSLLDTARQSQWSLTRGASVAECMKRDLEVGLDDPFDERASASVQEMMEWEGKWQVKEDPSQPILLFLRAQSSIALLKSKSVVETLLAECNSKDSTNLVVIGKGIDAKTLTIPEDLTNEEVPVGTSESTNRNLASAAPWFGFSPNNQNASGQNDPEGSRRFNIFLARTVDNNGTPGILGAIAPPQAGNLFPHMLAMQARERLKQHDEDSPVRAELERWAQQLSQQMQSHGGTPLPPPQFFNASLASSFDNNGGPPPPPPEVIQQTLQQAMSELLDRLAKMNDESDVPPELSPDLHKAFSQVLRNENLRRGIAENLARAAPALSDPKCQGVMLSVYVPPPPTFSNRGKVPNNDRQPTNNMQNWFQKIINSQEENDEDEGNEDEIAQETRRNSRQKRVRTMAAAAAVMAAKKAQDSREGDAKENKADRNLARLEAICRPIVVETPSDPVRAKSWNAWIARERGAVIFRQNRRVLNDQLEEHGLWLQEHTGTRGAGSALRQMLSVRDISDEMEEVIKCAIELEAAKAQRKRESPEEMHEKEMDLDVDITLSQLLLTEDGLIENFEEFIGEKDNLQYLHPSSLETALSMVCRISPSQSGGLSISGRPASHRTRDEIMSLAQDKHERALVNNVVSPQDIGVTYDMIGGLSDVKELLRQSITYPLKFPHLYSEGIAREAVKGVLLFGPPGTGKTMLAKAVATEGGASFLSVDASSVENKWLGESEKNAKAVFTLARRLAPCVIFIDEVDSLLSSREGTSDDSAHGTLTSVKTTMMSEWDGLNSGTNGAGEAGSDRVIVIGSTNRPFDLDEAVLRRFPRRILVDLPDLETRKEILDVTLAENRLDATVNLTKIAEKLDGYTGSDIKEVCREAVVQISHEQARILDQGFLNAKEDLTQGSLQRLRPVTTDDFEKALSKLKRSVSEKGRELARVWEWNDEYGEIKKEKKNHLPHLANMYL